MRVPELGDPPVEVRHEMSRTLSHLDNSWYTLLTMNTAPHFDLEYGRKQEFGRTLMNSTFTLAVVLGITAGDFPGLLQSIDLVRLTAPLFGDDTISVESTAQREGGVLLVRSIGRNQHGATVIEVAQTILPAARPSLARDIAAQAAVAAASGERAYTAATVAPRFEDFSVGDRYDHAVGRTMLADEAIWIALLSMNRDPVFFDRHHARSLGLKDLLVDRGFVLSTALGLSVKHTTQAAVANLGWRDVRFHHPVYPGDTLYAETEVLATRRSASRPGQGIVTVRTSGRNQDRATVVSYERSFLSFGREAGADTTAVADTIGSGAR